MKTYGIGVRYVFEGWFAIEAENEQQALEIAERDCGTTIGNIHTSNPMHVKDWEFDVHPETETVSAKQARKLIQ